MHLIVKSVSRRDERDRVKWIGERQRVHADRQKRQTEKAPHSQHRARDRSGHPLAGTMGWVGSAMGYYRLLGDVSTPISTNYPPYSVHRIHWYSYTDSYMPGCWGIDRRWLQNTTFYLLLLHLQQHVLTHPCRSFYDRRCIPLGPRPISISLLATEFGLNSVSGFVEG